MTDSGDHEEADFIPEDFPTAPGPALILLLGAVVVGVLTGLMGVAFLVLLR